MRAAPETSDELIKQEVGLFDLALLAAQYARLLLALTLLGAVLGLLLTMVWPKTYQATSRVLPVQSSNSATAVLGQLSSLGPLAALAAGNLTGKTSTDTIIAMLHSRSVADALIEKFGLDHVYKTKYRSETRKKLRERLSVVDEKDGTITLRVEDKDPKRAASLANTAIQELFNLARRMETDQATQRKLFFDNQVRGASESLADAETALKQTEEKTGMIKVDAQAEAVINVIARLRAQIAAREVGLASIRKFATDSNPDVVRAQGEIAALEAQLHDYTSKAGGTSGDVLIPAGKVPQAAIDYMRKYREVKYREALYEALLRQLETARVDEVKPPIPVEVIDSAVIPDKPKFPRFVIMIPLGAVLGLCAAAFGILTVELFRRNPTLRNSSRLILTMLKR